MDYPDIKAIVSGFFEPLDSSRCSVCGAELVPEIGRTCSVKCFRKLLDIQRKWTEEDCNLLIQNAEQNKDPRLVSQPACGKKHLPY